VKSFRRRIDISVNDISAQDMFRVWVGVTKEVGKRDCRERVVVIRSVLKKLHSVAERWFTLEMVDESTEMDPFAIGFEAPSRSGKVRQGVMALSLLASVDANELRMPPIETYQQLESQSVRAPCATH